jgi:hypothetical protein
MNFNELKQTFIKELLQFEYTIPYSDRIWELTFSNGMRKWYNITVSEYRATYYIQENFDEFESIEVSLISKNEISNAEKIVDRNNIFDRSVDEKYNEKKWTPILNLAIEWMKEVKKDWIKTHSYVEKQLPLKYRTGLIQHSIIKAIVSDQDDINKELGKANTQKFIKLAEKNYLFRNFDGEVKSLTADKYFEYCKVCYQAVFKGDEIDSNMSGRQMYKRFADGRDEGLLSIAPNSVKEFYDWVNNTHPLRDRGGHPFEIIRSGGSNKIDLRVDLTGRNDLRFEINLSVGEGHNIARGLKMFLSLIDKGMPIGINRGPEIYLQLLAQDWYGIVPINKSVNFSDDLFEEENVNQYIHYYELKKYAAKIQPFIKWKPIPIFKPL